MHQMSNADNELYNLKDDPEERRNRYDDKRAFDVRERLRGRLTAWQKSIDDPVLKLDASRPIETGPPVGQQMRARVIHAARSIRNWALP